MAEITAALVKELREMTGAGMMDCKKALTECDGDMDKAVDHLREKGLASAAKKAGRIAAEGLVGSYVSADNKIGVMLEMNCETDFVAKTDEFKALVADVAAHVAATKPADVEALAASELNGQTVAALVTEKIAKIGENISLRRFALYETDGIVATYSHAGGKIVTMVELKGGDAALAKDIAMQVAAAKASYLDRTQVPEAELAHEKQILTEQARNEGKPENIIAKMVDGRVEKYYKEVCLVDQPFIKNDDETISSLLKKANAEVVRFVRFEMGEGLEKKNEDFAAEVAAQMGL
ncbi:MAG: elongation factor Ts [Peptococcaceae bacterium]|nr:elongation factor Ts [Peptococcaceae bacterium]